MDEKYIDLNAKKRTNVANGLKKFFLKLILNSVCSKTMENLRKRINVRLVNNEKDFLKYTSRPAHITHKIFYQNYAAIHGIKPVLTLNKPIYVEFRVLELSKWLLHDFHYDFMKKNFDAELLFTDTDSLMIQLFTNTNICLTLAIFQKTQSFMIVKIKWSLAKWMLNARNSN